MHKGQSALSSRIEELEKANLEREQEWHDFQQDHSAPADPTVSGLTEVRTQVDELCATMTGQGQCLGEISRDVADLCASVSLLESHNTTIREEIKGLHQMCEHFAVYTDAEWWDGYEHTGGMPQGHVDPPPGFSDQPTSAPPQAQLHRRRRKLHRYLRPESLDRMTMGVILVSIMDGGSCCKMCLRLRLLQGQMLIHLGPMSNSSSS